MSELSLADVEQLAAAIDSDLRSNNVFNALVQLCDNPANSKDNDVKAATLGAAMEVFSSMKDSQVNKFVTDLSENQRNVALKYAFKCMSQAGANNAVLLKFHAEVVAANGHGSIMQSMADRKI